MKLKIISTVFFALAVFGASVARAQESSDVVPLPEKWNLYFQATAIPVHSFNFHNPYMGYNSFNPRENFATSYSGTWFFGLRIKRYLTFYVNPEVTAGKGVSHAIGAASYPNQEIFRVGTPAPTWNYARVYIADVIPLGTETEKIDSAKNQLGDVLPVKRITIVAGKFALSDFFDANDYNHDARSQFMNWVMVDNGAYDFMSDTHGYTFGAYGELHEKNWSARAAEVTVPDAANGPNFDWNLAKAHSENAEFEYRFNTAGRAATVKVLGFANETQAPYYADLVKFLKTSNPPAYSNTGTAIYDGTRYSTKYGTGVNFQQALSKDKSVGVFARASWNNGKTATWAFTPADRAFSAGILTAGKKWHRPNDSLGVAYNVNGISGVHKEYLAAGGYDFNIGDGKLTHYGKEQLVESYYTVQLMRQIALSLDGQMIKNPGYNRDRGPIPVVALRLHVDLNAKDYFKKKHSGSGP